MNEPVRDHAATPAALTVAKLSRSDASTVARIRVGDVAAFESLFHAHHATLHTFAARYVGSDDEAAEVVQDVFFAVWESRATWTPTTSVVSYLFGAVRNRALNRVRRHGVVTRHAATVMPTAAESVEATYTTRELDARIQRTLASLPERCRLVFMMNRDLGLTYRDIAAVLGISARTVESHVGRALDAFRQTLKDWRR
jgi:RNA polymerase sigma-70 factor, ECF subfamily